MDVLERASETERTERTERDDDDQQTAAEAALDDLPTFPLHCLPPTLAAYCQAAATALDPTMPPDVVALPILATIGSLMGNRLALEMKPRSWIEYPVLYVGIIGESGTAKSGAIKAATAPLRKIEHLADDAYSAAMRDYKAAKIAWSAAKPAARGPEPALPKKRRIVTTDSTFEALIANLEHTPGMVMVRDELAGWIGSMDAYRGGKGADRQNWLSMWSSADITVDRKLGGTISLRSPVVGVVGGIQPSVLPLLQRDSRVADGFIERLLMSSHRLRIPDWSDQFIPEPVWADMQSLMAAIDSLPASVPAPGESPGVMIHLGRDARALYVSWYRSVRRGALREESASMRSFASKVRNNVLRIALICHGVWHAEADPTVLVDSSAIEQAIEIGAYLEPHYRGFLGEMDRQRTMLPASAGKRGPEAVPLPDRIVRLLAGAGGTITRAHLTSRLGNVRVRDLDACLDAMAFQQTIRAETVETTNGRAARLYHLCAAQRNGKEDHTETLEVRTRRV